MFELLANGTVEDLCNKIKKSNIPYGFGGIAKIGQGMLPAEKVIMEHYRLGSTRAILSRSFCNIEEIGDMHMIEDVFSHNMEELRLFESHIEKMSLEELEKNRIDVKNLVEEIVNLKRSKS